SELRALSIGFTGVTPQGLAHLAQLRALEQLDLSSIEAGALEPLAGLRELSMLDLRFCRVDEEGMRRIGQLTNLRRLDLMSNYRVDDAGVRHLASLSALEHLQLGSTRVTSAGL